MVIAAEAFRWERPELELRAAVLWPRAVPVTPASSQGHADVAPVALVGSVVLPAETLADAEEVAAAGSSAAVARLVRPRRGQPARVLVQPPAAPVGAARVTVPTAAAVVAAVVAPVVVAVEIVVAACRRASWAAVVEVDAEPAIPFASRSVRLILSSSLVGLVLAVPGRPRCGRAASAACAVRRSAALRRGQPVVVPAHPGRAAGAAARLVLAPTTPWAALRLPERNSVAAAVRLVAGAQLQALMSRVWAAVSARVAAVVAGRWAFL